jgi:ribonuclease HI
LIEVATGSRQLFYGGMNVGTISLGELLPYVQALLWYANGPWGKRKPKHRPCEVWIFTDNQHIAQAGNQHSAIRHYVGLWSELQDLEQRGYRLHFRWIERNTVALNRTVDQMARKLNRLMGRIELPKGADLYG